MAKKPKKRTIKQWKTKIDPVFHEYVRRKEVDNHTGLGKCVTCNKTFHFSELDSGHFMGRQHLSTRWDERNVHIQCRKDNRFLYGLQYEYSLFLGDELSNELLQLSRQPMKRMEFEYEELFQEYKAKLKALKDIQNF